ncbi:MAG: hypothetical protein AAF824_20680 [Bacteroidota bacterium]
MNRVFAIIPSLGLVFLLLSGYTSEKDPRLHISKIKVHESFVQIDYEITFGGFVELHLFNSLGEKIWVKGKVDDSADTKVDDEPKTYIFRVSRKPLELDKRYSFILKYKGRDYSGSFYNALSEEEE